MTAVYRTKSLEEQTYERLEEDILGGYYKNGDSLTELSLCKRFGVSRTPVRSALHRLAEERLVTIKPNRGAVVVGITVADLIETYRIRTRLEGLASAMAATRITPEELKRLRDSIELSEYYIGKQDAEELKELDTEFHSVIYNASGNRMLSKILTELHKNIKTYRQLSLTVPGRLERSTEEHRQILDALTRGDGAEADKLTSQHIERAMNHMVSAMKDS